MEELNLKSITAYTIRASINEWESKTIGVYSTHTSASINANGIGWFGQNGNVELLVDIFTDGKCLYQVKCLGEFTDIANSAKNEMLEKIKAKLTPEEWEFYSQNTKQ